MTRVLFYSSAGHRGTFQALVTTIAMSRSSTSGHSQKTTIADRRAMALESCLFKKDAANQPLT